MSQTLRSSTRMDAVQAPIVPVIGEMIRQTPGTISLGQGVVHYGPPPAALDAVRAALTDPATHEYQDGAGLPALVERLDGEAARRERHRRGARQPRHGHRRREHGVHARRARDHRAGRRGHPATCRSTSITRWRFRWPAARPCASPPTSAISCGSTRCAARSPIARAPSSRFRRTIRAARCFSESALREVNALCRERGIYHIADEVYEYFTYGGARHVSPGSFPGAAGHTISMYSLSKAYGFAGWRIGYMRLPGASGDGDGEEPGHDPRLPDGGVAGGGDRRARRRPRVLRAARPRARRRSATSSSRSCRRWRRWRPCRRPTARSTVC